jgi:hypothetical protein
MEEGLRAFNAKIKQQKHNVLIFLDNATCHPRIELSNVELAWFFSNTVCVSQPIDEGVIKWVKLNYLKLLLRLLLANMETTSSATPLTKSVSVLDAVIWIAEGAKHVSLQMVWQCFQKAGFSTTTSTNDETDESNIQELQESPNQATHEDYLNTDNEVESEADVKEIDELIENHYPSKEEEDDRKADEKEDQTFQEQS